VAPPGNQAANGENKLQPVAMEVLGLLDRFAHSARIDDSTVFNLLKSLTSGRIERTKTRLEFLSIRTNILFCESEGLCVRGRETVI
jgi:hypothetical protein